MNKMSTLPDVTDDSGYETRLLSLLSEIDIAIANGELSSDFVLDAMGHILKGKFLIEDIPIWKTITMRNFFLNKMEHLWIERDDYYVKEFQRLGCKIGHPILATGYDTSNSWVQYIESESYEVDLVRVTPKRLGFRSTKSLRRDLFYAQAIASGLDLCFYETALALRLSYLDQPCGEWLIIATNSDNINHPERLLKVGNGITNITSQECLWVLPFPSDSSTIIGLDDEYIFLKPRKEEQT